MGFTWRTVEFVNFNGYSPSYNPDSGGDDAIYAGADWVNGGRGNDYIDGGTGDDALVGGAACAAWVARRRREASNDKVINRRMTA